MKIALNGILLKHRLSGVEISILNLARAFAESGKEQYVLHVPGTFPDEDIATDRFTTRRAPACTRLRPMRILWEQCVLPRLLAQDGVDILHAPGYIAPLRSRVPVIITVYDMIALRFPKLCRPTNVLNYSLMLPPSVRKAARIIVPSRATHADLLRKFPFAEQKTVVIHLGIGKDLHRIDAPETLAAIRTAHKLPERFILFTGRQEPKKNLVRLVEAFHMLRSDGRFQHKLVLAGTHDRDTGRIQRRIAELGLNDEVILTSFVPQHSLAALYSAADLFVFPSLYEGFGLPPLEAMACATPVVASNRASVPEIAGDAALLVDPENASAIANAVKQVLDDSSLRKRLVAAGLERAPLFSWEKAAQTTESLYTAVFADSSRTLNTEH